MPVHVTHQNVGQGQLLPPDGRIELAFDRLLLPASATRQSFSLRDLNGNFLTPHVAYDPVARVVTVTPMNALQPDQTYELAILSPSSSTDPNGLRAIDGATISPAGLTITVQVAGAEAGAAPAQAAPPRVDFCNDVFPILSQRCESGVCHGGNAPAAGLKLNNIEGIAATAFNRSAQASNTGPQSSAEPAGLGFGIDMPILDASLTGTGGGDPSNSWLMYKVLMAVPSATSMSNCNGAPQADVSTAHLVTVDPLSDDERARLSNMVLGREMPYPADPGNSLAMNAANSLTLTEAELERISLWLAQTPPAGGLLPASCTCN